MVLGPRHACVFACFRYIHTVCIRLSVTRELALSRIGGRVY